MPKKKIEYDDDLDNLDPEEDEEEEETEYEEEEEDEEEEERPIPIKKKPLKAIDKEEREIKKHIYEKLPVKKVEEKLEVQYSPETISVVNSKGDVLARGNNTEDIKLQLLLGIREILERFK